ncbi:hypothetical protein MCOR25_010153 [Pyricularia grisea]|nr:hypothetical protein MCOR25_010153 [Pyricularia grisea]
MSQVGPAIPTPFGNLVVRSSSGGGFWLTLPTGSTGMRAFMAGLAINQEEARVCAMPSRDIEIKISSSHPEEIRFLAARILRRESYFRAILVQSRGHNSRRCPQKCGNPNASPKFRHCVRLRDYQDGACGECVWQSHGARCAHSGSGSVSGGSDAGDDGGPGPRPRALPSSGSRGSLHGSSGLGREIIVLD